MLNLPLYDRKMFITLAPRGNGYKFATCRGGGAHGSVAPGPQKNSQFSLDSWENVTYSYTYLAAVMLATILIMDCYYFKNTRQLTKYSVPLGNDGQVSISPIFFEQLLRTKVFCAALMCLQFGFVVFWRKDFGAKLLIKCWWNWHQRSSSVVEHVPQCPQVVGSGPVGREKMDFKKP